MKSVAVTSGMKRLRRRMNIEGFLFISPWLIGFIAFQFGPIIASFVLSAMRYDIITPPIFTGAANYIRMVNDHLFWKALANTLYYVFVGVPLRVLMALVLALLINQRLVGRNLFRAMFYIPSIIRGATLGLLWLVVFQTDYGLINGMLRKIGIIGPPWLKTAEWAMPSMIIVAVWGMGAAMVIFLAGLQGIPKSYYETADIDGASPWKKLLHITLPLLSPVIFFNMVMTVIHAFQIFAKAYIMTEGGPLNSTLVYVLYLYRVGFEYLKMGYGSALALVLFVIIFGFTLAQFRLSKWVHYEQ